MLYGAMNFPVRPVLKEVEAIAKLGFDYLELAMDPPEAHHSTIMHIREDLRHALDDCGLKLVCHLPAFLSIADLTESLREASVAEMLQSLDVAARLEPLKVVVHPGYVMGIALFVKDIARRHAAESLGRIVRKADELGLRLCLENMFPQANALSDPSHFVEVFERFPQLELTLDTGHARMGGGGDRRTVDFIERFAGRLGHVHTGDNFGTRDDHLPIGAGTSDFKAVVLALKRAGYDQTVTLEVFSPDRDYLRLSREKFAALYDSL